MRKLMMAAAIALPMFGTAAIAQETVKIAYIDPLSGGGASIGEIGLKTFQFLAEELNAKGGVLGKKVEIVAFDNKTNPQESLIQAQKAIDQGIRILTQGNGSNEGAAWAPNGRHIVFSSNRSGRTQLYTMLVDGTEQQPLTRDRGEASSPTWSPRPQLGPD